VADYMRGFLFAFCGTGSCWLDASALLDDGKRGGFVGDVVHKLFDVLSLT